MNRNLQIAKTGLWFAKVCLVRLSSVVNQLMLGPGWVSVWLVTHHYPFSFYHSIYPVVISPSSPRSHPL